MFIKIEPPEPAPAARDGGAEGRVAAAHLAVKARAKNFKEVDLCVSEKRALCEAGRVTLEQIPNQFGPTARKVVPTASGRTALEIHRFMQVGI